MEEEKLADDDSSTSFLSNWRLIIPLLKVISDDAIALTCIRTIVDVIAVGDLPDIFHTLWFEDYIYHSDKRKRNYCHQLINLLCIRFFAELNEILSLSRSDGDFFTFDNFDILTVLQSQKHQGLLKSKAPVYLNSDRDESEIYQIRWYERQKLKLERFLKFAADSDDVSLAIKYDTIGLEFVEDRDFKKAKGKRKASEMEATPDTNTEAHTLSEVEISDLTKETWFARLFRYLIVNLSHDEWEVRSSSASAIEAILMGLNEKEIKPGEVSVSQGVILQMRTIPIHLLEDIVCLGLTVLVVDQFIDYDCDSERNIIIKIDSDREDGEPLGFSPVKERISHMIVAASQLMFLQKPANPCRDEVGMKERLFRMILDLCQNESWTTKLGGFLVLTAFLRFNQEFVPKFLCSNGWKILEKSLINADNKEIAATSYLLLKFLTTDYPNRELKKIELKSVISSSLRHLIDPLLSSHKEGEEQMLQDIRIFTAIALFSIFMNSEQENELKLCDDWSLFDYYCNFYCFIISHSKQCIVSLSQLNIAMKLSSINECFNSIYLPTFIEFYPRLLSMLIQSFIFLAIDGFLSLQVLIRAGDYDQTPDDRSLFIFSLSDSWQINHRKFWDRHQNVIHSVVKVINAILNTKIVNKDIVQEFWTAVLSLILNDKLENFSPDYQIPLITEIIHSCHDSFNLFSLEIPRKYLFFHIVFVVNFPSEFISFFPSLESFRIHFLNPLKECSNDIANDPLKLKKKRFVVVANNKVTTPAVSRSRNQADVRKIFIEAILFELLLELQGQRGNYSEIEPFVGKHPEFWDLLKALKAIPQKKSDDITATARDLLTIMEKEWKGDLNSCITEFLSRLIGGVCIDPQVENFIHVVQQLIYDGKVVPYQRSLDSSIASAICMRTKSSEIGKLLNFLMSNNGCQISEFHFHYLIYRLFTVLKISALPPFYQKVLENIRMNWRDFLNKFLYPETFQQYSDKCLWLIVENVRLLRDFLILSERFQFIEYLGITLSKIIHENRNYDDNNLMQNFYSQLYIRFIDSFSNEISISSFDVWLGIGVKGFGLFDLTLRSSCIKGFRLLVPLAPLGLHHLKKTCNKSFTLPLIQQLLARSKPAPIHENRDLLDQQILSTLFQLSSFSLSSEVDDKQRKVSLRSYQWEGITWWTLLRRCGLSGILTDEMGLGKTVQALVCAAILRIEQSFHAETTKIGSLTSNIQNFHQDHSAPILIICPASLTFHWQNEILKFFPDSTLFHPLLCNNDFFQKRKKKLNPSDQPENGDIFIVSYDMLRSEANYFQSITWEMIILDEAHLIRNPAIATTQAIFQLKSYYRLALTGTPLQNHVEDIWSIMNFLLPGYLGTFPSFQKEYVRPIKKTVQKVKLFHLSSRETRISTRTKGRDTTFATPSNLQWKGIELLNSLHKQILPFILRRNKSEVLKDLPPKTVIDILCPLSSLQEKMYRDGLAHFHSQDQFQGEINEEDLLLKHNQGRGDVNESNLEDDTKIEEDNHSYYEDVAQPARKNLLKANPFQFPFTMSQPTSSEKKISNPLQLLTYLQSVCFHPASVIDRRKHSSYYSSLARSLSSSGKFIQLLKLLIDIDIITEEDYSPSSSKSTNFHEFIKQIEKYTNDKDLNLNDGEMEVASDNEIDREDKQMEDSDSSSDGSGQIEKEKNNKKLGNSAVTSISKKCLIFCKYQQSLDLLETQLFQSYFPNLSFRRLDGSMPPQERFKIATQFNSSAARLDVPTRTDSDAIPLFPSHVMNQQPDVPSLRGEEIRILLMTTRSCGLGLNLCSADTVIFLEHDWNPFVDLQAMDRVHRLGQQNPVTVYRLLADAPVERRIQSLQNTKIDMSDEVVCGKSFHQQKDSEVDKNEKTLGLKLWESLSSKK